MTTDPVEAILATARELRDVASALGAAYLTAHVPAAGGEVVVLTVEDKAVTLSVRGFEARLLGPPDPSS